MCQKPSIDSNAVAYRQPWQIEQKTAIQFNQGVEKLHFRSSTTPSKKSTATVK